ncbi:hypothetical protein Tco_0187951 [Tanacetum coccineum]
MTRHILIRVNSCTWGSNSAIFLQMASSAEGKVYAGNILRRALPTMVKVATVALRYISTINFTLSWDCNIGPSSFLPPVLLLMIVVVSVAVVVVVLVVVVGVSLMIFPFPLIAFTNSTSPTLN